MRESDRKAGRLNSEDKKPERFVVLCGRIFRDTDVQYFPSSEYRGRKLLFCTESCLGAFLADPHIFYKAHRNSEKNKNPVEIG
jgi:YHS domain-containing protein